MKKNIKSILVYVDTSVFGGVFDEEFKSDSIRFFELVNKRYFKIVTSYVVKEEIDLANIKVRTFFNSLTDEMVYYEATNEATFLRNQYIKAGILTENSLSDALHVAIASTSQTPLIISWNFKHLVNFQKIPLFNAVNLSFGYTNIGIYSPKEVIEYEG